MQRICTSQFSYHSDTKTFTACASTLGNQFNGGDFELVSDRTGKVIKMVLAGPRYDRENDLTHWEFQPHECFAFNDLIIFND